MKELPEIVEEDRPYGTSGYTGPAAKELARRAAVKRDVELTDELFLDLCDRLVQGEPLVMICADQTMPSRPQLMRYLFQNAARLDMYYAAREMQCETLAEEMMAIANDDSQDSSIDSRGRRISHNEVVQRARLKVDVLTRTMSKMAPKRFGDKNFTEIQGSTSQPVVLQVVTGVPRSETSLVRRGVELTLPVIESAVAQKSIEDDDRTDD